MKKEALLLLFSCSWIVGMELEKEKFRESREWNAQEYSQGNKFQEMGALKFIQGSGIDFTKKRVVDIGCGTGNVTFFLAQLAKKVHGIDASDEMIQHAAKVYKEQKNLSFEHCFAENFFAKKPFDKATSFFCLHWIEDKQSVIKNINKALAMDGEFFGTHYSTSNQELVYTTFLKKIMPFLSKIVPQLQESGLVKSFTSFFVISDEEFKALLINNGFELVSYEQKSFDIIMSTEEISAMILPVLMSRPFMQLLPDFASILLFNTCVQKCIDCLSRQEDGNYIFPADSWGMQVFRARKIKENQ